MVQCVNFCCPTFQWQKLFLLLTPGLKEGNFPLHLESAEITAQTGLPMIELITQGKSNFTSTDDFTISLKNEVIEQETFTKMVPEKSYKKLGGSNMVKRY